MKHESQTGIRILSFESLGSELLDQSGSPEERCSASEQTALLNKALRELPSRNRQTLEDYYYNDFSLDEIGRRMGLSRSWVCRLRARSIRMIRDTMTRPAAIRMGSPLGHTK